MAGRRLSKPYGFVFLIKTVLQIVAAVRCRLPGLHLEDLAVGASEMR
jgi:hypothetical protein